MATQTQIDVAGMVRPDGALDAAQALQPYRGPLNERSAAHLLRRAGFGGTPDDIRRYASMSVNDAVESLVRFPNDPVVPIDDIADYVPEMNRLGPEGFRDLGNHGQFELRLSELQHTNKSIADMQVWWLNRMLAGTAPLQEKMTLAYHGHFTTEGGNKAISAKMMWDQNQLFRTYAVDNLRELTRAVSKNPAMMAYLDNGVNTEKHPNENYARELMELFTMGVDTYTEDDVRESARAWTGWRYNQYSGEVVFWPRFHDDGTKMFLGQTGNFDGDDIVNIIYAQPQTERFLATWLINTFLYNNPEPELVDAVAGLLHKYDFVVGPVVSTILRSQVFYSNRAYRALVKSPVEFVVGTYKALGLTEVDKKSLVALRNMGQILFHPPNVAGWPGGSNWITSATMVARQNFLTGVVNSENVTKSSWLSSMPMEPHAASRMMSDGILQGDASPASLSQLDAYLEGAGSSALGALSQENFAERASGAAFLALASPAFQLS